MNVAKDTKEDYYQDNNFLNDEEIEDLLSEAIHNDLDDLDDLDDSIPYYIPNLIQQDGLNKIDYKKNINWKKKDVMFCNNCARSGHNFKRCYEPIMSFGIICLKLKDIKLSDFFINKYKFPNNNQILKNICISKYIQKNISCNNKKDLDIYEKKTLSDIDILMVRRNYTFNYIYLIRGIYDIEIENIIKCINLLTQSEYEKIMNLSFEELWYDIWRDDGLKSDFDSDFKKASEQFNLLRNHIIPLIDDRIEIKYTEPEWGFPKGKRNSNETNLDCAIREFKEETGLSEDNYIILDRLFPLIENVVGSNGVRYRYIYYVALMKEDTLITEVDNTNSPHHIEIGDIGLYSINNSIELLRDYNTDRSNIINNIKLFLMYNSRYFERFYHMK